MYPIFWAPKAEQVLLDGSDMGISGLNPQEFKKISQNIPMAYDLLPSKEYYNLRGSYLTVRKYPLWGPTSEEKLNYEDTLIYLKNVGLNSTGIKNANDFHSTSFDYFDPRSKGIDSYNIIGCQSNTFHGFIVNQLSDIGPIWYVPDRMPLSGDDTVPFESADSIPVDSANKFYFQKAAHGGMPSNDGIRKKIVNIITGAAFPQYAGMVTHAQLAADNRLCELSGDSITIKSPVDIAVVDDSGRIVLGVDADGNARYEVPGASFEIMGGHKYVYLPTDMGSQYKINLKGSGTGTFTLIDQKIEGDQVTSSKVFNDIPVTPQFSGSLEISGNNSQIVSSNGSVIVPTSIVENSASTDVVPSQTTALINGQMGDAGIYRGAVTVNLSSQDFSQSGITPAGVFSIDYSLDDGATSTIQVASTTIDIADAGTHKLVFLSSDKLGNKETQKTINFTIVAADTQVPQITCGNADGQWHNDNIAITCVASDDDSGLADGIDASFTLTTVVDADRETDSATTTSRTVCDKAGNCAQAGPIAGNKIDRKAPMITASAGSYMIVFWSNQNVVVHFECQDGGSGIAVCPTDQIIDAEGITQTVSGVAIDNAGNQSVAVFGPVKIDKTGPEISVNRPEESRLYILNEPVTVAYGCSDAGSGVASCVGTLANGASIDTGKAGSYTFTVNATDNAGNAYVKTISYKVGYRFYGFLQPINDTAHQMCPNCPASIFKGGSTIPVKFQLKDYSGNFVQAPNLPEWVSPLKGGLTTAAIDESIYFEPETSGSNFRYDSETKQYIFNWGTKGFVPGYFWRIGAKLGDGTVQTVNIGLR